MELADRLRRVWLLLYRAYRTLHQRGLISESELEEAVKVLEELDRLPPEEIRARLARLGRPGQGLPGQDVSGQGAPGQDGGNAR